MIYVYDLWAQLPVKDLFDTLMMIANINAHKDMYEKAAKEMENFRKEYGDFLSPIEGDMDWYSKNVIDKVRNTINDLYNSGIDPLRSAEGRATISRMINDMDYGRIARNKQSAKNAEIYLQNKAALEAAGEYDPDLEERYLGFDINKFDSGDGIWGRLSPIKAKSLKALTESSYNNRTQHLLTQKDVESFGIPYDARAQYRGFTYNDLVNVANTAAPGLKGTIYYDYYKDIAKQQLIAEGNDNPTESDIANRLAKNIANSQIEYMIKPDPNYDLWDKEWNHRYKQMALNISRARAAQRTSTRSTSSSDSKIKPQFDYNDFLIGSTAANVLGKTSWGAKIGMGGVSDYEPDTAGKFMKNAQKEIALRIYNYDEFTLPVSVNQRGNSLNKFPSLTEQLHDSTRKQILGNSGIDIGSYDLLGGKTFTSLAMSNPAMVKSIMKPSYIHDKNLLFLSEMSIPASAENFAIGSGRLRDGDDNNYVLMDKRTDVGRIYSGDEVALTSAGVNASPFVPNAIQKTKELRKRFEKNFSDGKTMMRSEGFVVGRVGEDGSHHIFLKIRISNKNKTKTDNNINDFSFDNMYDDDEVIYYDMGVDTQEAPDFKFTGNANMTPRVTDQSLALDRAVLKNLGLSNTEVKSDESVPDVYNSYDNDDDILLQLMME